MSPLGRALGQMSFGALLAWDVPCAMFLVPGTDVAMQVHHLMMTVVGYIASGAMPSHYFTFFLGLGEASSVINVAGAETLHPKKYLPLTEGNPVLQAYNEAMRALFALSFLVSRGLYFTYIIVAKVMPDLGELAESGAENMVVIRSVQAFCVAFTILQLYWSWLILGHIGKALSQKEGKKKELMGFQATDDCLALFFLL